MCSKAKKMTNGLEHRLLREDRKGEGKGKCKGKGMKGKRRRRRKQGRIQRQMLVVWEVDTEQANATRRRLISEAQARTTDQERHDQPEQETDVGTFDMCALEHAEESKHDASNNHDEQNYEDASDRTVFSNHAETVRRDQGI